MGAAGGTSANVDRRRSRRLRRMRSSSPGPVASRQVDGHADAGGREEVLRRSVPNAAVEVDAGGPVFRLCPRSDRCRRRPRSRPRARRDPSVVGPSPRSSSMRRTAEQLNGAGVERHATSHAGHCDRCVEVRITTPREPSTEDEIGLAELSWSSSLWGVRPSWWRVAPCATDGTAQPRHGHGGDERDAGIDAPSGGSGEEPLERPGECLVEPKRFSGVVAALMRASRAAAADVRRWTGGHEDDAAQSRPPPPFDPRQNSATRAFHSSAPPGRLMATRPPSPRIGRPGSLATLTAELGCDWSNRDRRRARASARRSPAGGRSRRGP